MGARFIASPAAIFDVHLHTVILAFESIVTLGADAAWVKLASLGRNRACVRGIFVRRQTKKQIHVIIPPQGAAIFGN
jgi:hypothetical protein